MEILEAGGSSSHSTGLIFPWCKYHLFLGGPPGTLPNPRGKFVLPPHGLTLSPLRSVLGVVNSPVGPCVMPREHLESMLWLVASQQPSEVVIFSPILQMRKLWSEATEVTYPAPRLASQGEVESGCLAPWQPCGVHSLCSQTFWRMNTSVYLISRAPGRLVKMLYSQRVLPGRSVWPHLCSAEPQDRGCLGLPWGERKGSFPRG